jgi:hypothetical protein
VGDETMNEELNSQLDENMGGIHFTVASVEAWLQREKITIGEAKMRKTSTIVTITTTPPLGL